MLTDIELLGKLLFNNSGQWFRNYFQEHLFQDSCLLGAQLGTVAYHQRLEFLHAADRFTGDMAEQKLFL